MGKKVILFILGLFLLYGCSSSDFEASKEKKGNYAGLNATETYEQAIEYFNQNVSYVKSEYIRRSEKESAPYSQSISEFYFSNGKKSGISAEKQTNPDITRIELFNNDHFFQLDLNDEAYWKGKELTKEERKEKGSQTPLFFPYTKEDRYDIKEITKEENEGEIILKLKYHVDMDKKISGAHYYEYVVLEYRINKEGFIYEFTSTNYEGDWFKDKGIIVKMSLSDFNKKQSLNYEQELENLKKLIGQIEGCEGADKYFNFSSNNE